MSIARVQTVRKIVLGVALLVGLAFFAVTAPSAASGTPTREMIKWLGVVAMVICIFGRTWCTMYIGGRKEAGFVTEGPYSVTRNPLYLFSVLGGAGAAAQLGSVVAGVGCGLLAWIVFYVVVLQEERAMAARHAGPYQNYMARVPRFVPNPWLWRDVDALTLSPAKVVRTFADAMILLLAVPFAQTVDLLQAAGTLPVLFHLP